MHLNDTILEDQRIAGIEAHLFSTWEERSERARQAALPTHEYVHVESVDPTFLGTPEFEERLDRFLSDRTREGFHIGVEQIRKNGFTDPAAECRFVVRSCEKFDTAVKALAANPELQGLAAIDQASEDLKAAARDVICASEISKVKAIVALGSDTDEGDEATLNSPALWLSQVQDLLHTEFRNVGLIPKAVVDAMEEMKSTPPASKVPEPVPASSPMQDPTVKTQEGLLITTAPSICAELATDEHLDATLQTDAVDIQPENAKFMGIADPKLVDRKVTKAPLMTDALLWYLNVKLAVYGVAGITSLDELDERDNKLHTCVKDLKTLRSRIDHFVELVGNHSYDSYTVEDLQDFVYFLRYLPANHSKMKIFNEMGVREVVEVSFRSGRRVLDIGTPQQIDGQEWLHQRCNEGHEQVRHGPK